MAKSTLNVQGFIQGGGDRGVSTPHSESLGGGGGTGGFDPPLRISGGGYPPLFLLIQKETCHQGIINSWLCYSLLGEALGGFSN